MNAAPDLPLSEILMLGRSTHSFTSQEVEEATLERIFNLMKWGPTSFHSQPARFHFLRSTAARERLVPALSRSNREKTLKAPMTAIVAYSPRFWEELPARMLNEVTMQMFRDNTDLGQETDLRNSTLQGAYFMMSARSMGLGVGPMSGFDPSEVNRTFFPNGKQVVNFLINLGYPADANARPRGHRFAFTDVVSIE
jgi:3-hydroxypropanoate dehydrogenase